MSKDHSAGQLLDLLGEERVRQILAATSREPLSAKGLSEECDVALSTIYRRVEEMVATDLLVERTQVEADGSHHSVYESNVDHLDVDIEDGTIDIRMQVREDAARRFSRIWSEIRDT
ncbi:MULTISPECIES: ArsR/SmtB family transcription factor [Haloarcula]|uniref:ArsR/SmtB family transcription factor n=1 Tax=Haloarcula TaxID=2237 RepID=UPI0023E7D648|nr:helix-turn-helix domain-containing protein [Halomicroarcula sp. SHR3]